MDPEEEEIDGTFCENIWKLITNCDMIILAVIVALTQGGSQSIYLVLGELGLSTIVSNSVMLCIVSGGLAGSLSMG